MEISACDEVENGGFSMELIVSVNMWGCFNVVIEFSLTQVGDVKNIMINPGSKDFDRIVKEADISKIDLMDSGFMELDYEDPDERALEEYYQWEWGRDEEQFAKWSIYKK